jgi:hypothetical protein
MQAAGNQKVDHDHILDQTMNRDRSRRDRIKGLVADRGSLSCCDEFQRHENLGRRVY